MRGASTTHQSNVAGDNVGRVGWTGMESRVRVVRRNATRWDRVDGGGRGAEERRLFWFDPGVANNKPGESEFGAHSIRVLEVVYR